MNSKIKEAERHIRFWKRKLKQLRNLEKSVNVNVNVNTKETEENKEGKEKDSPHTPYKEKGKKKKEEKEKLATLAVRARGEMFDRFWKAYPKKKSKNYTQETFDKLIDELRDKFNIETIMQSLESQKKDPEWKRDDGRFIPRPFNWLRDQRWTDTTPEQEAAEERRARDEAAKKRREAMLEMLMRP